MMGFNWVFLWISYRLICDISEKLHWYLTGFLYRWRLFFCVILWTWTLLISIHSIDLTEYLHHWPCNFSSVLILHVIRWYDCAYFCDQLVYFNYRNNCVTASGLTELLDLTEPFSCASNWVNKFHDEILIVNLTWVNCIDSIEI